MSDKLSYWGDGAPILLPDRASGGMDYWGDGEPSPGLLLVVAQTLSPSAIDGAEAFGTAQINSTISPVAIATEEAIGVPKLNLNINPVTITSEEDFGTPWISANTVLKPVAIDSQESVGVPTILRTSVIDLNTTHNGIVSGEGVGVPVLHCGPSTIEPAGIDNQPTVGTPFIWPGPVTVTIYNWILADLITARNLIQRININDENTSGAWSGWTWNGNVGHGNIIPGSVYFYCGPWGVHDWHLDGYCSINSSGYGTLAYINYVTGAFYFNWNSWTQPYGIPSAYYSYWSCTSQSQILAIVNKVMNFLGSGSVYSYCQDVVNQINNGQLGNAYLSFQNAISEASKIAAGIPSQEAVGHPTLRPVITPAGIVSLEAVGQPTIIPGPALIYLDDEGIESQATVGRPRVQPGPKDVSPEGIPSEEAFGTAKITPAIRPEAISSEEACGSPTLTCGPVDVRPAGIDSKEAVGMPLLGLNIFRLIGVESGEAFGDLTIECGPVDVKPVAIDGQEEVGTPKLGFGISAAGGIDSEEAVGEPTLNLVIFPVGVISKERFGTAKMKPGPVKIYARAIDSDSMVGHPLIKNPERADIIVLESRCRVDLELAAGQAEIELYWDEREVVNG